MPRFPTPSQYQEAVQFPEAAFVDAELQDAEPETTALGLPKAVTGAFAVVFPLEAGARRWAAKCFLTDVRDQARRYRAISAALADLDAPFTVGFDYQTKGIRVDGETFPVLKMEWAEGIPLNRFVQEHLDQRDVLHGLSEAWLGMLGVLEEAHIAHGDLQHGNVLVELVGSGVQLRLVDYDTMYVPALKGRTSPEVGHRNYQHPDRSEGDFGPYLDRFAGLSIFLALRALAERPGLWSRFDTGENLLFRASDFYDPAASPLFRELAELGVAPVAELLQTACYLEPDTLPPVSVMLREGELEASPRQRALAASRSTPSVDTPRTRLERWFLAATLALVALAAVGGVVGGLGGAAGVVLGSLVVGGGAALWQYHRHPVVRRRRRLRRELAYFDRLLDGLGRQAETLTASRENVAQGYDALRAERLEAVRAEALEARLKHHFVAEAGQVDGITHKVIVRLKNAGIRTAVHATPERLQRVTTISDESRARVALWRAGLVAEHKEAMPERLSPAEERRLERQASHRAEALGDELRRVRDKWAVQSAERADVEERLRSLPHFTGLRYLAFLLRLAPLPPLAPAPPPPTATPPPGDQPLQVAPAPAREDEQPWWKQSA